MYRCAHSGPHRPSRASRGAAMAGIVLLHAGALALGLSRQGPRADAVAEPYSVLVAIAAEAPRPDRPPAVPVDLHRPSEALPLVPAPVLDLAPPPAPAAITAAARPQPPAPPPPAAPAARTDDPVEVSEVDYLDPVRPVYPAAARRARAQGTVLVRALVDEGGRPREVRVHQSSGFQSLDKAACDAVMKALFRPHRQDGVARRMVVIVPIEFSLAVRTAQR